VNVFKTTGIREVAPLVDRGLAKRVRTKTGLCVGKNSPERARCVITASKMVGGYCESPSIDDAWAEAL